MLSLNLKGVIFFICTFSLTLRLTKESVVSKTNAE